MTPQVFWNHSVLRRLVRYVPGVGVLFLLVSALALLPAPGPQPAPVLAADLPQPANISCQGRAADEVVVRWEDTATDETNYRVERSIDGGSFSEVDTISPDGNGNYSAYVENGVASTDDHRYRVRSYRSSDDSFSPYSEVCNNRRVFEEDNFRIFYGLRNGPDPDDCPLINGREVCLDDSGDPNDYVDLQATALQGSADAFTRVGFDRDAFSPFGGLDKLVVNVVWCDGGGCAGGGGIGLSPFLMETAFDLSTRAGDPVAWIVAEHEMFHFQQYQYGGLDDPASKWVYEGQARSTQDKICIGADRGNCEDFDDIDTGYAGYVPEVKGYLGNTNRPINETSYQAALFWTYLVEKYGTLPINDSVEGGMNLMAEFWKEAAANPGRDGIAVLNSTLANLGHSDSFRDAWKNFAVANYAKDLSGPGVQSAYQYDDMAEPGGNYGPVDLDLSRTLNLGEQAIDTDESVTAWGARYYELRPAADVPILDIKVTQDSSVPLYYTILGIKGTDVAFEYNIEARDLDQTLVNDSYDRVVIIIIGLENGANYRYSFNGQVPILNILSPTTGNKARVGDPDEPDKFLLTLEVVAPDGTPLSGVNLNNFSFRVGDEDVPESNILTRAKVQGQHWFVVRAPTQEATGAYDLLADYSSILSDTNNLAVNYIPRADADNMLLIDHSGSMSDNDKLASAQDAARLYVDSWREGDKLGVVGFDGVSNVDMALLDWTDSPDGGSRQTAFDTIGGLVADGGTAIGDALRDGWDELNDNGVSTHDWALILLSDGEETAGTETFENLIDELSDASGKKPVVHTVAVGPDADRLLMQRAATRTGGTYQYVSEPGVGLAATGVAATGNLRLDMDTRYRAIATEVIGQEQFYSFVGPIPLFEDDNGTTDVVTIPVEGSAATMVLSLSWDGGIFGDITLRDPDGLIVSPFQTAGNRHVVWRVDTPKPGDWSLTIWASNPIPLAEEDETALQQQSQSLPPYLLQGSLRTDVTMDAFLTTPLEDRFPGEPIHIVATLTDVAPIPNASVVAIVEQPDGDTFPASGLTLFDDGLHDDGEADDGVYANTYYNTGTPGSYVVTVEASGTSDLAGGAFEREKLLAFHLNSEGDRDGDGLPDEWEERKGTDPDTPDANDDPDNDGSDNAEERDRGTDPLDPDTDDGGEADGNDDDPFDPSNDDIEPTWASAYPGDEVVYVKFAVRSEYTLAGAFRSLDPTGPFSLTTLLDPQTGIYTDTDLINDQTYCYIILATDTDNNLTAPHDPVCAIPRADPFPPYGFVLINDGVEITFSPAVTLTLWASDTVDEEGEVFTDPPLPSADSASGVTEMRINNTGDMEGVAWEPYATTKAWTLDQQSGLAAVFVQYRDAAGNESDVFPATILVDPDAAPDPPELTGNSPADGATDVPLDQTIVLTFSKAIDTSTLDYTLEPAVGGLSESWSNGDTVLTLSHDPFTVATAYTVTVTAASDTEGEALVAAPIRWNFTTVDDDGGGDPPVGDQRIYLPLASK
jgi:hypothetical protein